MINGQEVWNTVREKLKKKLAPHTFDQSFKDLEEIAYEENGVIFIVVGSIFTRNNINKLHIKNIESILEECKFEKNEFYSK